MRGAGALVALALVLDGVMAVALLREPAGPVVHPLVPPLTRVDELRDHPLAAAPPAPPDRLRRGVADVVQATGTPEQRAAVAAFGRPPQGHAHAVELRMAVEADAVAIAEALGPARVAAAVAERERLADAVGEGRLWARAVERVTSPGGP